jgi:hypothetical protein
MLEKTGLMVGVCEYGNEPLSTTEEFYDKTRRY